ncbi:HEAT repeat domain-containing protein [Streptomyces sp. NPDC059071]|uniref:HEAT repeat domain-containing protein n=1 Tax=unclassified Streptomyces TaxID=2593676 RepID=UPI00365CA2BF
MRRLFKRRPTGQSATGASADGSITLVDRVSGNVTVVNAAVPAQPPAPDIEAARAAYATRLRQRYGRLDLEVLTPLREQGEHPVVPLREVFVPQSVRADPPPVELPQELLRRLMDPAEAALHELPPGVDRETVDRVRRAYRERPPQPVLEVLTAPEHPYVVLLGDPGAGKSTLARYLALALTAPEPPPALAPLHGHLPLIIELRGYAQAAWRERSFEDFLGHLHETEGLGLPPAELAAALAGPTLVIFDGLDEIFEKDVRHAVTRRIAGFAARHPRARVLVTSRGHGYQRAVLDGAGFADFMLQDLDRAQIGAFTEQWFAVACPDEPDRARRLTARVTAAVDGSSSVRELAGNPLILTILSIIGRRRELPRDRRTVYEHAVDVLVEHWDPSKYLRDHRVEEHLPYLAAEDKRELLRLVARHMQEGHGGIAGNHIAGPDLIGHFEEYLKDRYALAPDRAATAARIMLDQFRHRNFILSRFGGEIYGFVHRAFLEYLTATDLAHRFNHQRELSEEDLQNLFAEKVHDPAWHEVLLLLVGALDERFVAGVLDRLLTPRPIAVPLGTRDDGAFAEVVFVARCLAEVRRLGVLAAQSTAMVRKATRLFDLAGVLDVTFFFPYKIVDSLGPTLVALGDDWAGRDEYLWWHEQRAGNPRSAEGGSLSVNSTWQLATDVLLFLRGRGEPPRAAHLAETVLTSTDPVARIGAVRLLVRRAGREPATRDLVAHCLRHDASPDVRSVLMGQLAYAHTADRDWLSGLAVERLEHDDDPRVRRAALECLQRFRIVTPEARAALGRVLGDPDPLVRSEALHTLALHAEDGERAVELLREAPTDTHPTVRAAALSAVVARTGDEAVIRALVMERLRNDDSPEVVASAIDAVRAIGSDDPGTYALLRELTDHPSPEVRRAALRCLAEGGTPREELPALLAPRLAHDESRWVRETALLLFVAHVRDDSAVREALLDRVRNDPGPSVQNEALTWLVAREPEATRGLLVDRVRNHPDEEARSSALRHLWGEYGDDPEVVRLVLDQAVRDESREVRFAALVQLLEHDGGAELVALAQDRYENDPDESVRVMGLRILADLRREDPGLLPLLRRAAASGTPRVRSLATAVLAVLAPESP